MREIRLREFGPVQNRVSLGVHVRRWLKHHLASLAEGETLVVNCEGVTIMSTEYATAAFGSLMAELATGDYGQRSMGFSHTGPDVDAAITEAVEGEGLDVEARTHLTIGRERDAL